MRYIELTDTTIDREKVTVINRDPKIEGRVHVTFDNGVIHYFDGHDAALIFAAFRDDAGTVKPHVWQKDE